MRVLKIVLIGMIVSIFLVGQAYSAPKGNNGKSNKANNGNANNGKANNNNANNGKAQAAKSNLGNNKAVSQTKGKSTVHKQQARRSQEANRKRQERNRSVDRNNNGNSNLAFNNRPSNNRDRTRGNVRNDRANRALDLLDSLDRARWSHNPHDDRGQGNMGKPDMQDPFGHDKDSGREKWEHARPEHVKDKKDDSGEEIDQTVTEETIPEEEVVEEVTEEVIEEIIEEVLLEEPVAEEPIILEEPTAEELAATLEAAVSIDWQTEDSAIVSLQYWIDRYESLIQSGSLTQAEIDKYNYYINNYKQRIVDIQALDYQRLNLAANNSIDYSLNLNTNSENTYLIETTLVLTQDYSDWVGEYVYNPETGTWSREEIVHKAGETITLLSEEVTVSSEDGTYAFSLDPGTNLVDGFGSGYWALEVEITDTTTETTVTQTMDKTLLVYRDPYGKVEDSVTGQAVVGAKITVFTEDGSIVALDKASNPTASNPQMTDATGRFGFNLRTNRKYYMVAAAPGYENYQTDVFTEQWHVIREDIKMTPKLEKVALNIE